jgi:hypothetical protein
LGENRRRSIEVEKVIHIVRIVFTYILFILIKFYSNVHISLPTVLIIFYSSNDFRVVVRL